MNKIPDKLLKICSTHINIYIDGSVIDSKDTFLQEFSKQLAFPDYFGFNWDAFFDCMTDLSWLEKDGSLVLAYWNSYNFRHNNPEEWGIASELLFNIADYWHKQDKTMVIIFV